LAMENKPMISIRVKKETLIALKLKAKSLGVGYQTLINLILDKNLKCEFVTVQKQSEVVERV
jgi:predicted DNA binding CopG/RHH family protein